VIRFQDVRRAFGEVVALDGLSWRAEPARVTAVLGPNGAGKTTAVEIAEGLQRADSGTVQVLGTDPWRAGPGHRARVGVMLQDGGLPPAVRPGALLRHLASFYRAPADVEALVETLGIGGFDHTVVRRLSGGQRQRLAIARALANEPTLLLADEPTGALDSEGGQEVIELFRRLHSAGQTILMVTHDDDVAAAAHRIARMKDGKVVDVGRVDAVAG